MNFKIFLIYASAILMVYCSFNFDVNKPVNLLWDKHGEKNDSLIIFLPGLFDNANRFKKEQFFSLAREAGVKADMVAASIHVGHLLQEKMFARIEKDIYQPAKKAGYKNMWLVGMSLGGLNSLLFYQKYTSEICGVVLLAPYIVTDTLKKEFQKIGELKNWRLKSVENESVVNQRVRDLWVWLLAQDEKKYLQQIYLGFGEQDRYVDDIKLLQRVLDKKNVIAIEGKHDWVAGKKIWQLQLMSREKTGLLQPCN